MQAVLNAAVEIDHQRMEAQANMTANEIARRFARKRKG